LKGKDEVDAYISGRYVCAHEALSRIYGYSVHDQYPKVERLPLHQDDEQSILYQEGDEINASKDPRLKRTQLIAYFDCVQSESVTPLHDYELGTYTDQNGDRVVKRRATELTYQEFPEYYVYDKYERTYTRAKERRNTIGRIYYIAPNEGEPFYLRMLLTHVCGAKGYDDLKTFNHVLYPTFRQACAARGLLRDDQEWIEAMKEAVTFKMPWQLRLTFTIILTFNECSDPMVLWEMFRDDMVEDYLHKINMATKKNLENKEIAYNHAIKEINQHIFKSSGGKKSTTTYGLPEYDPNIKSLDDILKDAERENEDNRLRKFVEEFLPKLNEEQKKVKDIIDDSIQKDLNKLIYIDAPGGSGKTFLFNLIIASLKLNHKPVSICAHSGVSLKCLNQNFYYHSYKV
jgi:hypothetical protein